MTLSTELVAPYMARFLDVLDASFRGYGVPDGLPAGFREAVAATPRHCFVHRFRIADGALRDNAADPERNLPDIYSDAVMRHVDASGELLPSSNSQPSYVLFLLYLLGLDQGQAVLEIGSGSGWLAAIMARLVGARGHVVGVELIPELAARSQADLAALGINNVEIITGDGTRGYAARAPYDRAIITAATWQVPAVLLDQVVESGRILVPIELASGDGCDVTVLCKHGAIFVAERSVPGWFVPLRGYGQVRPAATRVPEPAPRSAMMRHSLPLGFGGHQAPAAVLLRAFLGRTEPRFVVVASAADGGWRPGMPVAHFNMAVAPFGVTEADGSVALWQAGEIVSYNGPKAAARLAKAYAHWAVMGLPGMEAFRLEVHKSAAAPTPARGLSVEARGETVLAWQLKSTAGSWRDLIGPDDNHLRLDD